MKLNKNFLYKGLLLIVIFFVSSCRQTINEQCSKETPWGTCSEEDICYDGTCIGIDEKCGVNYAPCDERGYECKKKSDSSGYECVQPLCSRRYKKGKCEDENTKCIKGVCTSPCSLDNKNGFCEDSTQYCLNGECKLICGASQFGECLSDQICAKITHEDDSVTYKCEYNCSVLHKNGYCEEGSCNEYGKCFNDDNKCSTEHPNGECENSEKICLGGSCVYECSKVERGGFCKDQDKICINKVCENRCSNDFLDGACNKSYKKCVAGNCRKQCSDIEPNGYCTQEGYVCLDNKCIQGCSVNNPNGACEDIDQICDNGGCKFLCSKSHKRGLCFDGKECISGECNFRCSVENQDGVCEDKLKGCQLGICTCIEGEKLDGTCNNPNPCQNPSPCQEKDKGQCIEGEDGEYECFCNDGLIEDEQGNCIRGCSKTNPNGACPEGRHCERGDCVSNGTGCADNRPATGISGACCKFSDDCTDGFRIPGNGDIPTNVCIDDNNPAGSYCIGVKLKSGGGTQNDPDACSVDADCADPFPGDEYDGPEEYFCNEIRRTIDVFGQKQDLLFTFCQRVFSQCERKNKQEGEVCDNGCHDAECARGLHCIEGICTSQCKADSDCQDSNNSTCLPFSYNVPGTVKYLELNLCLNQCNKNSDCTRDGEECNASIGKFISDGGTPSIETLYCREAKDGIQLKESCTQDSQCKSRFCDREFFTCTTPCESDEDCDNGYCHYNFNFTKTSNDVSYEMNYLGVCRYTINNVTTTCSKKDNCQNGENCLPKFKDTELYIGDSFNKYNSDTSGVCGMIDSSKTSLSLNDTCVGSNIEATSYCATGLCICKDQTCPAGQRGSCKEYCETTSDCSNGKFCKRVMLRDESFHNVKLYGGFCTSEDDSSSFSSCIESGCPDGETCVYNPVNLREDTNNLNRFSSEYICKKELEGKNIGESCLENDDCKTRICMCRGGVECTTPNVGKCSIACTSDNDCGQFTCNKNFYAVYDSNSENAVFAGVCNLE